LCHLAGVAVALDAALLELLAALLPRHLLEVAACEAVVNPRSRRQIQQGQRGHFSAGELGADRG